MVSNNFHKIILLCVTIFCATPLLAAIELIAGNQKPAAGFPPGFSYFSLSTPVIGPSGHIVFSGIATKNAESTRAVWGGLQGALKPLLKTNDTLIGFPSNVLYSGRAISANRSSAVVTKSGKIGLMVDLSGPVNSRTFIGQGIAVLANGEARGILRNGQQAPGYPPGHIVFSIGNFAFTDAGMIVTAVVYDPNLRDSEEAAFWYWDFSSLTLIPSPIKDCKFFGLFNPVSINKIGEIVFASAITGDLCPDEKFALFKFKGSKTEIVLADGDPVPGMPNTSFDLSATSVALLPGLDSLRINDRSEFLFFSQLHDSEKSLRRNSLWVINNSAEPELLLLGGEFVSGNESSRFDPATLLSRPIISNDLSMVMQSRIDGAGEILIGEPRASQIYSSLDGAGATQLSVAAQLNNEPPPGFGSTWFFRSFTGLFLNDIGEFVVGGSAIDARDGSNPFSRATAAIWQGNKDRPGLERVVYQGMPILIENEQNILSAFAVEGTGSTIGGRSTLLDNNNQLVFTGSATSSNNNSVTSGIFLLSDKNEAQEQRIFTLAEQKFSSFFAPANSGNQTTAGFLYRFYPRTNTYLGIKSGEVFVLGAPFGPDVLNVGTTTFILDFLERM